MMCNLVYAHLVAGLRGDAREEFDANLYAPPGGWDAAEEQIIGGLLRLASPDEAAS